MGLTKQHKRILPPAVVTVIVGLLFVAFISAPTIKRQLNDWKLLPQPEYLTELYFSDHQSLPKTYIPGTSQTVSFTVHNLESTSRTYQYEIRGQNLTDDYQQTLASGTFDTARSKTSSKSVDIILPDLGDRAKITVAINTPHESIDYLIRKEGL